MRSSDSENPRYFIQSLAKGLKVLQSLARAGRPLTVSEIAETMGMNSTTTMRFCYTLNKLEFIYRDSQRRYHLSPKLLSLGYPVVCSWGWQEIARYYLHILFEEIHETLNLAVLDGHEILFVERIRKTNFLPFDIRVGTRLPVYCTAMGKILMAIGPPEKTKPILDTLKFRSLTPSTITRIDDFLVELKDIRGKGYSISDEELSVGARSIAAPVVNVSGYAVAAINVSVLSTQYTRKEMEEKIGPVVMATASQISDALLRTEDPFVTKTD